MDEGHVSFVYIIGINPFMILLDIYELKYFYLRPMSNGFRGLDL